MRRIIITFTLIFLGLLAVDAYPGLRGGGGWRWPYEQPQSLVPALILALVLIVYLAGVWIIRQRSITVPLALAWMIIGGAALGYAAAGIQHGDALFTLFTRTVSPVQTGASTVAVREMAANGVQPTLERWPDVMREALDANIIHFTTSPPGQPLLHYTTAQLTENTSGSHHISMALRPYQCSNLDVMRYTDGELVSVGLLGLMMPLWAALAVIPIYFTGRLLLPVNNASQSQVALHMASWWPLVPTVLMFAPTWNTLYPFLCMTSFALLCASMRHSGKSQMMYGIGAGIVMSFTTFLNFAVAPVLLLFGLFTLGYGWFVRERDEGLLWPVRIGLWFGIGLLSVWALFWIASGLTPLDLAQVTADKHSTLVAGRDRLTWLLLHPYDVLMFMGWPLAAIFILAVWMTLQRAFYKNADSQTVSPVHVLAAAMGMTFIAVDLAGVVQGENARILAFYAPFMLLAGAHLFQKSARWDLPLLVTQALTVLVMAAVLPVVPLDLNLPPDMPRADVPLLDFADPIPVGAHFEGDNYDGEFTLQGHRFVADLGAQVITLETIWQGGTQVERPYQFRVIARAENDIDGEIVTEPHMWYAQNGNYLPTCWRAADVIHDVTLIDLPAVSAPVQWTLDLQAIDERTGDVMQITAPDGSTSDHISLGPVNYP